MLAQYSIKKGERSIGSGAFGQVIIGTRRVDGRNYALKHVDSRDEEWKREYQLLSEMRHDTISAGSGSRASAQAPAAQAARGRDRRATTARPARWACRCRTTREVQPAALATTQGHARPFGRRRAVAHRAMLDRSGVVVQLCCPAAWTACVLSGLLTDEAGYIYDLDSRWWVGLLGVLIRY